MQRSTSAVHTWTTSSDLRAQVQRLWDRGELLASIVEGQASFPKRFSLKVPTSIDMTERFDDVRAWVQELQATSHCRLEMREFRHRVLGTNQIPAAVWIDTADDAVALVGKQREAARFLDLVECVRKRQPDLFDWATSHPFAALDVYDDWSDLLEVVGWIKQHPRPGVYLRQVDIPGIHSKFLEEYRGILSELLDVVLPPDTIDSAASGVTDFAKRYGFLDKPIRIRFRILDPSHSPLPNSHQPDITLDAENFSSLHPKVSRVFITENEINFLVFPKVADSLIIFGSGYGFTALAKARWLSLCRIHYWGDIDTHGFAILDQLRSQFADVQSFLMDRATLMAFEAQWGVDEKQTLRDLTRLNDDERALYDDLRDNRIRKSLRLEQERVSFRWVEAALSKVV